MIIKIGINYFTASEVINNQTMRNLFVYPPQHQEMFKLYIFFNSGIIAKKPINLNNYTIDYS